jgi:hypothetical protein
MRPLSDNRQCGILAESSDKVLLRGFYDGSTSRVGNQMPNSTAIASRESHECFIVDSLIEMPQHLQRVMGCEPFCVRHMPPILPRREDAGKAGRQEKVSAGVAPGDSRIQSRKCHPSLGETNPHANCISHWSVTAGSALACRATARSSVALSRFLSWKFTVECRRLCADAVREARPQILSHRNRSRS